MIVWCSTGYDKYPGTHNDMSIVFAKSFFSHVHISVPAYTTYCLRLSILFRHNFFNFEKSKNNIFDVNYLDIYVRMEDVTTVSMKCVFPWKSVFERNDQIYYLIKTK